MERVRGSLLLVKRKRLLKINQVDVMDKPAREYWTCSKKYVFWALLCGFHSLFTSREIQELLALILCLGTNIFSRSDVDVVYTTSGRISTDFQTGVFNDHIA